MGEGGEGGRAAKIENMAKIHDTGENAQHQGTNKKGGGMEGKNKNKS